MNKAEVYRWVLVRSEFKFLPAYSVIEVVDPSRGKDQEIEIRFPKTEVLEISRDGGDLERNRLEERCRRLNYVMDVMES